MAALTLRLTKGSPLTNTELDNNFSNLNTAKLELGQAQSAGTANSLLFLNGTKLVSSGTALTFDGTTFRNTAGGGQFYGTVQAGVAGATNGRLRAYTAASDKFIEIYADGTTSIINSSMNSGVGGPIAFLVSDSEQMRLTSTGLGIGTSSPYGRLTVLSNGTYTTPSNANQITVGESSGNAGYRLQLGYMLTNSTTWQGSIQAFTAGVAGNLILNGDGGNVGIGTSIPQSRLDVYNPTANSKVAYFASLGSYVADHGPTIVLRVGTNGGEELAGLKGAFTQSSQGNYGYLAFLTRTSDAAGITEKMRLTHDGSLGLGYLSPSSHGKLAVGLTSTSNSISSLANFPVSSRVLFGDVSGASTTGSKVFLGTGFSSNGNGLNAGLGFMRESAGNWGTAIMFYTHSTVTSVEDELIERMRIDSAGNLLIGSSGALTGGDSALYVNGSIHSVYGNATLAANSAQGYTQYNLYYGGSPAADRIRNSGYGSRWSFDLSGGWLSYAVSTGNTVGGTAGMSELLRIDRSGNLGLGVAPGSNGRLTVYETTNARLFLTDSTLGATYGGQVRGYGVGGAGGNLSLGVVDANVYNEAIRVFNQATAISFYTNSGANGSTAERARFDSTGIFILQNDQRIQNGKGLALYNSGNTGWWAVYNSSDSLLFSNGTERARIDSGGNLLVGTTSKPGGFAVEDVTAFAVGGGYSNGFAVFTNASTVNAALYIARRSAASQTLINFATQGATTGSVTSNGTTTAYNTGSDYRLKNITGPITNSGAYIDSLNPVEGTWKADGSTFVGLIAHEVQEASRTQVATGVKDGEQMQGMDYSSSEIIANLIAEVKSLRVRVAQLEAA